MITKLKDNEVFVFGVKIISVRHLSSNIYRRPVSLIETGDRLHGLHMHDHSALPHVLGR